MATKVHMEALSPTMEEGQVVRWLKSEGEEVSNGEILAEIETDKATMELVARGEGLLRKILLGEGSTAPVGTVIAVIGGPDEDIGGLVSGDGDGGPPPGAAEVVAPQAVASEDVRPPAESEAPVAPAARRAPVHEERAKEPAPAAGERVKASPLARRLAAEQGIQLGELQGSGPAGRIVKRDVEEAVKHGTPEPAPTLVAESDYEDVPLSQMRKTIAKRLVESIAPVPHFFLTVDVDMSRTVDARRHVNALLEGSGVKVSFNDIVLKATATALRRHPECNAHWRGDHVRRFSQVHLGVAVAIDDGLITPVVRNAQLKGLAEIATEVRTLAARAREKRLRPEEYTGATFSVSNLGMFGIHEFTGVINPPEAGILAVGAVEERAVVHEGVMAVRRQMKVTMSCDHRVIDGAQGSRFLGTLRSILEEPLAALI